MNMLIKPASGLCNMRCGYCFYEDESENRLNKCMGIMSTDTADALIASAFSGACSGENIVFSFQGGEPTLAGLDFFRHFVKTAAAMKPSDITFTYTIQTNGLAIDDEWIAFLKEHRFLVGLSMDGTKSIHDNHRPDAAGKGTWNRVTACLKSLLRAGVEVNLLCVVTAESARSPQMIYNNLKGLGARYLQFIPCLDPLGAPRGSMPWSLTPEKYGKFLCGLFDCWYHDWETGDYVSVRFFEDHVHLAMGSPAGTCATSGRCGAYFVVEGDGSVYPCDFYALDEWKMGNIRQQSVEELAKSDAATRFLGRSDAVPTECGACRWQPLCRGGCRRDRYIAENGTHNYYCEAFRKYFAHAESRLLTVARAEAEARGRYRRS